MVILLSENIRKMRTSMGLNQVEFAKRIGVSKQCVSNWENDNVMPSVEMLVKIADFFKVTTDFLVGRDRKSYIDVSGLTDEQIGHVALIINDIKS